MAPNIVKIVAIFAQNDQKAQKAQNDQKAQKAQNDQKAQIYRISQNYNSPSLS